MFALFWGLIDFDFGCLQLQLGVDESYSLYVSDGSEGGGRGSLSIVGGVSIEVWRFLSAMQIMTSG